MIAAIRVKGEVHTPYFIRDTMQMLRLDRKNHMVLLADTASNVGMLKKVEYLVTFGPMDAVTLGRLLEKRGRLVGDKHLDAEFLKKHKAKDFQELASAILTGKKTLKELGVKPVFRLHPPKKGFGRAGIKKSFSVGGGVGNRKEKINELIKAMS